ncbi:hypothetical protein CBR_g26398 [Chara braunii]|uniref:Oleosin n=1 Tax=Chara braunii TaxID=69332 RepID=A0A388L7T5_CHABU|nr:hypothetical protein CBR_g26398 [Chara braunii]|eukprot:GBG78369.1 hypothetical protein CBR_g26398 [Chara braunii]
MTARRWRLNSLLTVMAGKRKAEPGATGADSGTEEGQRDGWSAEGTADALGSGSASAPGSGSSTGSDESQLHREGKDKMARIAQDPKGKVEVEEEVEEEEEEEERREEKGKLREEGKEKKGKLVSTAVARDDGEQKEKEKEEEGIMGSVKDSGLGGDVGKMGERENEREEDGPHRIVADGVASNGSSLADVQTVPCADVGVRGSVKKRGLLQRLLGVGLLKDFGGELSDRLRQLSGPQWALVVGGLGALFPVGTTLSLALGGPTVILGATVLLLASPVIILSAPLWIPLAFFLLSIGGVALGAGGGAISFMGVAWWLVRHVRGDQQPLPVGALVAQARALARQQTNAS